MKRKPNRGGGNEPQSGQSTTAPHERDGAPNGAARSIQTPGAAIIEPYIVHTEPDASGGQARYSLSAILRFRATFLAVCLVIAAAGTAAAWILIEPEYKATALLNAEPRRILYRDDERDARFAYERHLKTLVALIESPDVFGRVVLQPEVMQTAWFNEKPRVFIGGSPTAEERLRDVIEVEIARDSFLIEIRATASNAQDAATIANAVQGVFIKYVENVASEDSEYVVKKLKPRQNTLDSTIQESMRESFESMKELEAVSPEDMIASRVPRIQELRAKIEDLDIQITLIEVQIKSTHDQSGGTSEAAVADQGEQYLYEADPTWTGWKTRLDAARIQLAEIGRTFGAEHSKVKTLTESILAFEKELRERETVLVERRAGVPQPRTAVRDGTTPLDPLMLKGLKEQKKLLVQTLKENEKRFREGFDAITRLSKDLDDLHGDKETKRAIDRRLDFLETEGMGVVIRKAAEASAPSYHSNWKRPFLFTGMSLFAGMFVGFICVNWRARRTPDARDFARFSKAPVLGLLPPIRSNGSEPGDGLQSESIRVIRTAVLHRLEMERGATIMFTSCGAGTGKTTTAVSFATSMARAGKRVLLVDADFRRPHVAEALGIESEFGLGEVLLEETTDAEAIVAADTPGLSVLPGTRDRVEDNVELLANGKFTACLARWRQNYDFIVLDCCPVQPMADAQMLFPHVDGVIVVVREGRCRQRDLDSALACIDSGGGRLLGTVFVVPRRSYNSQYYQYEYAKS